MRKEDKAGFVCLILGNCFFYLFKLKLLGLFFQGAALGFFLRSMYLQLKERKR